MTRPTLICSLALLSGFFSPQVHAATMTNDRYTLQKNSVNIEPFQEEEPKKPQEKEHKVLRSGRNYTVDTNQPEGFSFTLSQNFVDFGKLTATNPVIRTLDLRTSASRGYQIFGVADHPLYLNANMAIPDTTCDNGSCSDTLDSLWENTLTYGFGYHLESMEANSYQQFADAKREEAMQLIETGGKTTERLTKLTYKVNISGTQQPGAYSNTITFIATPDF